MDEEDKMMATRKESAHMVASIDKGKKIKKTVVTVPVQKKSKDMKCFFCSKSGHQK